MRLAGADFSWRLGFSAETGGEMEQRSGWVGRNRMSGMYQDLGEQTSW